MTTCSWYVPPLLTPYALFPYPHAPSYCLRSLSLYPSRLLRPASFTIAITIASAMRYPGAMARCEYQGLIANSDDRSFLLMIDAVGDCAPAATPPLSTPSAPPSCPTAARPPNKYIITRMLHNGTAHQELYSRRTSMAGMK